MISVFHSTPGRGRNGFIGDVVASLSGKPAPDDEKGFHSGCIGGYILHPANPTHASRSMARATCEKPRGSSIVVSARVGARAQLKRGHSAQPPPRSSVALKPLTCAKRNASQAWHALAALASLAALAALAALARSTPIGPDEGGR